MYTYDVAIPVIAAGEGNYFKLLSLLFFLFLFSDISPCSTFYIL